MLYLFTMKLLFKSLLTALACMLAAILIVAALVVISRHNTLPEEVFNRHFIVQKARLLFHAKKLKDIRAVCGMRQNKLYFETGIPGNFVQSDITLSPQRSVNYISSSVDIVQSLFTTFIDSSYGYIMAGNVPGIIKLDLDKGSYQLIDVPGRLFSQSLVIDKDVYVFRAYKKTGEKWDQVFMKVNSRDNSIITDTGIQATKGDAGLSTDGMLLFDKGAHRLLYVEYYHNQFICMDTSLHLLYKRHTVDHHINANFQTTIKASQYGSDITNASPLTLVNLQSTTDQGKLYICSGMKAGIESTEAFKSNAVIDVYQITDGHYTGSFYLPDFAGERLMDFYATAGKLVVLYSNHIAVYTNPSQ